MKRVLFPYPTLAANLDLTVENVQIDGQPINLETVVSRDRVIDINKVAIQDWEKLTFDVHGKIQKEPLADYESRHGEVLLTVVASCRPTNTRQGISMTRSNDDRSLWTGTVDLDRNCFRGKVSTNGLLTCELNEQHPSPIGFSDVWTIYFDVNDSIKVSGSLKILWFDFKSNNAPYIARQFPDSPYVVDLEKTLPEIYLNESFEGLEPLLRDSKERNPVEQVLHDTMRMSIARSVWMTLVNDSMAAIREGKDGEDHEWPEKSWQEEVLRSVLPEIDTSKSESQLLDIAATEWRHYPGSSTFQGRAEAVVGEIINANKYLRKSIQKLIREGIV